MSLQQNSEAIFAARGADREKQQLETVFLAVKCNMLAYYALIRKSQFWFSGLAVTVIEPVFRSCLIEVPFLRASTRQVSIESNAEVLGQVSLKSTIVTAGS